MNNGIIVFDIVGCMAHFRKYYTNSSSMSYSFPPRTTVAGMIAAILGYNRDSYYALLGSEQSSIGISVRSTVRQVMQTVNYLHTTELAGLNGSCGHTQIPLNIILPGIGEAFLRYRIYFSHKDSNILRQLQDLLYAGKSIFPLYLGLSEFTATAEYVASVDKNAIEEVNPGQEIELSTVCNVDYIARGGLNFGGANGQVLQYNKERMPVDFGPQRQLKTYGCYISEKNQRKIKAVLNVSCLSIKYGGIKENIVFM